jgi:ubiquinone/menaquinone biosynthesis C-methylase UbiE
VTLRDAWEEEAERWARWARAPGHDSYWRFHRDHFLELVPPPGRLTVDLGCGEGRLTRDLKEHGHHVVGVDASPTLLRLAQDADPGGDYVVADAAALPFAVSTVDLVLAFMSLQDMDDMESAVREAARILAPGGRFCIAVVHPINSGGTFDAAADDADAPFLIAESYFERRRYSESIERDGLAMTFTSYHRSLQDYVAPLVDAGFVIDRVREVTDGEHPRWRRLPLFLHIRAVKP